MVIDDGKRTQAWLQRAFIYVLQAWDILLKIQIDKYIIRYS